MKKEGEVKMNVIDLFSGVGGFSTGFLKAGHDVILANEFDKSIAESYKKNHPNALMINEDIKDFSSNPYTYIEQNINEITNIKRQKEIKDKLNDVNVIIGGPPCQSFSMAGSRIRKKKDFIEDPRNNLFKYYYQLLKWFEPEYFVFENVEGLMTMNNGDLLSEIVEIFSDPNSFNFGGYNVDFCLVDFSRLGVPQKRKRLIIIGSKSKKVKLKKEIKDYIFQNNIKNNISIKDAISDLSYLNAGEGKQISQYIYKPLTDYQRDRRKNLKQLYNHKAPNHSIKVLNRISELKQGQNFKNLKDSYSIKSIHSGSYGRLNWEEPAYTITTRFDTPSAGRVIHPEYNRALTPREAARIQSFDDDFVFIGSKSSIGKQIGNAVPPIAAKIIADIIKKINEEENIEH